MWSASTAQGCYRQDTICSIIFALDSKARVHPNSQGGELLNYKKNIQFLKLYYTSQQLPLVSTAVPLLTLLLPSVRPSVSLRGHDPFPEHSPLASPPDAAALLTHIPPAALAFSFLPPWGHGQFRFSTPPFCARFPPKLDVFQ